MILIGLTIIILSQIISYLLLFKKTGDQFNPIVFTFIFIFFPFVLSHAELSVYQYQDYHPLTYLIFITSALMLLLLSIFIYFWEVKNVHFVNYLEIRSHLLGVNIIYFLTILFCFTYLFENYLVSGHIISISQLNIVGDTHLDGVKGFRELNTTLRVLLPVLNIYMFVSTKKKRYLILSFVSLIIPLSRGSRSTFFNSIIIIIVFLYRKIDFKKVFVFGGGILALVWMGINLGNFRRSYTTRAYAFEVGIFDSFYNETFIGNIVSWYYGYYSLSFHNFNSSLLKWMEDPDYYFGLSNLNGLVAYVFSNYPSQQEFNYAVSSINGAANVPTAYYYYLIDFGVLGILAFDAIFYAILFTIYYNSINSKYYRLVYCYLLFHILNFVFYSSFYAVYLYPILILMVLLVKKRVKENTYEDLRSHDSL
ncbi:O-antigen polymerase [Exiguobacterium alkaliphilum]|uniref:O-antigen polymerase n=1 Tax=Exiguobacterium alkaliphilum TaxID=1428684 RepID=UPI003464D750